MPRTLQITGGFWTGRTLFAFEGGPWRDNPGNRFGVCLLERLQPNGPGSPICNVWLPVRDFNAPEPEAEGNVQEAVKEALRAALDGQVVYVGCMGGKGRTGLFLALLVKAIGHPYTAVARVRSAYDRDAVETEDQEAYVEDFKVGSIRRWLFWQILNRRLSKMIRRR